MQKCKNSIHEYVLVLTFGHAVRKQSCFFKLNKLFVGLLISNHSENVLLI